jgi:hypothetical protein
VVAGVYRVNRVVNTEQVVVKAEAGAGTDEPLPETYVDYETPARVHAAHNFDLLGIHHPDLRPVLESTTKLARRLGLPGGHGNAEGHCAVVRAGRT